MHFSSIFEELVHLIIRDDSEKIVSPRPATGWTSAPISVLTNKNAFVEVLLKRKHLLVVNSV